MFVCLALGAVVGLGGLGGPVAQAADTEVRELEQRSKLDLGKLWQEYQRRGETRPFVAFVDARYRRQRDVGRGLLFGGLGLGVTATAMFFLALPRNDASEVTYASYAAFGVSVGLIVAGSVMWRRNFKRLEQLEAAGFEPGLALGPRLRLRGAGPIALPRGAGLGVHFTF
jgi:hypothetical protein